MAENKSLGSGYVQHLDTGTAARLSAVTDTQGQDNETSTCHDSTSHGVPGLFYSKQSKPLLGESLKLSAIGRFLGHIFMAMSFILVYTLTDIINTDN